MDRQGIEPCSSVCKTEALPFKLTARGCPAFQPDWTCTSSCGSDTPPAGLRTRFLSHDALTLYLSPLCRADRSVIGLLYRAFTTAYHAIVGPLEGDGFEPSTAGIMSPANYHCYTPLRMQGVGIEPTTPGSSRQRSTN